MSAKARTIREKRHGAGLFWKYLFSYICVMLVPVIMISTLSYTLLRTHFTEQGKRTRLEAITYAVRMIEQQISGLNSTAAEMSLKSCFVNEDEIKMKNFYDIVTYLMSSKVKNKFVYDILYADMVNRNIYTQSSLYHEQDFEDNLYHYSGTDLFGSIADLKPGQLSFIPLDCASQYGRSLQILTVAIPVKYVYQEGQRKVVGCAVFMIEKSTLDNLVKTALQSERAFGALYYAGELVYCSQEELAGQLPSFEAISQREALQIEDETYGVLRDADYQPNGLLSMVGLVPENELNDLRSIILWSAAIAVALTVALSSLLIFCFMRLNYRPLQGLFSFVRTQLKGFLPDQMNEVEATQYAISKLTERQSELLTCNQVLQRERCFYTLLDDKQPLDSRFQTQCLLAGLVFDGPYYQAVILADKEGALCRLQESFSADRQIYWNGTAFAEWAVVLMSGTAEALEEYAGIVTSWTAEYGIGRLYDTSAGLRESCREAQRQLCLRLTPEGGLPLTEIRSAHMAVSSGDTGRFLFISHSMADSLSRMESQDTAVMVYSLFIGGVLESLRSQNGPFIRRLPELEKRYCAPPGSAADASRMLLQFADEIAVALKEKAAGGSLSLQAVLDYIGCCCFDPSFSIKTMSEHFGVTPSNLSHFFKSRTGLSLSQHIQSIKITKAKELLVSTSLTLAEIIGVIGYADSSSFIRRFKTETGMTPGEFRSKGLR